MKLPRPLVTTCLGAALLISCKENPKSSGAPAEATAPTVATKAETRGTPHAGLDPALLANLRRQTATSGEREALVASIRGLGDEDLKALLKQLGPTRNSREDRDAFSEAMAELARREPEAVLAWFKPEQMSPQEAGWGAAAMVLSQSRPELLEKWLLEDFSKAPPEVRVHGLIQGIALLQSGQGIDRALQFFSRIEKGLIDGSEVVNAVFMDFNNSSPADAEKAARQFFRGEELDHALYNIAMQASRSDLGQSIVLANKITDLSMRNRVLAMQYRDWFDKDPAMVIGQLGKLDPKSIGDILKGDPPVPGMEGLVAKLGKNDPDALVRMMGSLVVSGGNRGVFEQAIGSLSVKTPEKALELIEGLPDGGMKNDLYEGYFTKAGQADPVAALQQASALPEGEARQGAYRTLGGMTGDKGFEETLKMAETVPKADRDYFLGSAMPYLVNRDPQRALALLDDPSQPLAKEIRQDTLSRVGNHFCRTDPASAREWMKTLPAEDQAAAMHGVAEILVESDIQELSGMLSSLPKNQTWANGVKVLLKDLQYSDPARAKRWQDELEAAGLK